MFLADYKNRNIYFVQEQFCLFLMNYNHISLRNTKYMGTYAGMRYVHSGAYNLKTSVPLIDVNYFVNTCLYIIIIMWYFLRL